MDSTNPFSHSSGFMDLLNSRHATHSHEANPYESLSPSIELGESEVHVFSSQWSLSPSIELGESEVHVFSSQWSEAPSEGENSRSRRLWSPTEDVVLISAWLNTSKDPIVGNEQKAEAFWKRIAAYVSSSPKLAGMKVRGPSQCKQRWGKINDVVCKFVGCYKAASSQKSSGQNENDVMKLANQIFLNDHKMKFTLEHAWRELRHDQKWCQKDETGMPKRRKFEEGSTQSSSSHPLSQQEDEAMARPAGVKASKAKGKRTAVTVEVDGKDLLEFQSMWEIKQKDFALKQKDFALKEKHSKHKLLESLLGKAEPLSEIEMVLKNKLINDMLSNA